MFTYVHLRFAPHPQKYDHFFIVIIRYRVVLQKNIAESTCICDHVWNIHVEQTTHITRYNRRVRTTNSKDRCTNRTQKCSSSVYMYIVLIENKSLHARQKPSIF